MSIQTPIIMSVLLKRSHGDIISKITCCRKRSKKQTPPPPPWLLRLQKSMTIDMGNDTMSELEQDIRERMKNGESPVKLLKQIKELL